MYNEIKTVKITVYEKNLNLFIHKNMTENR